MATAAVLWVVYDVYGVYVLRVVNIFPIRDAETREKSWIVTSWFGNKQHQVGYVGSFFYFAVVSCSVIFILQEALNIESIVYSN